MAERVQAEASSPAEAAETGNPDRVEPGIALCPSGGGYRAMLFPVGATAPGAFPYPGSGLG